MLEVYSQSMQAPGVGENILKIANHIGEVPPCFIVHNKDTSLSASISYRESNDGSTWTEIVNTPVQIIPGASNEQLVISTAVWVALFAYGNVLLDVHFIRHRNGVVSTIT